MEEMEMHTVIIVLGVVFGLILLLIVFSLFPQALSAGKLASAITDFFKFHTPA